MPQTPPEISRILEYLNKQKECFVQLLEAARRQQKAIDENNEPDLLKDAAGAREQERANAYHNPRIANPAQF